MTDSIRSERRRILIRFAGLAVGSQLPITGRANVPVERTLSMIHTHTRERIQLVYAVADRYVPDALRSLNWFLRDHYTDDLGAIDPRLFDLLHQIQLLLRSNRPYEVISGYRCAKTNTTLRETRGGGVAKHSLHMEGRAIDVRLQGVAIGDLRDAALSLRAGGTGFYPAQRFVHIDTGRIRHW